MQLIDINPSDAKEAVQNLADLYRYILSSTKKEFVTIGEEIESINTYLAVQKARFGRKLKYSINMDPLAGNIRIPPMILQPVVENAVNHGANDSGDIVISIVVSRAGSETILRVSDKGSKLFDPAAVAIGSGTGLKNIEGRLFSRYRRKPSYDIQDRGGLAVSITIPEESG